MVLVQWPRPTDPSGPETIGCSTGGSPELDPQLVLGSWATSSADGGEPLLSVPGRVAEEQPPLLPPQSPRGMPNGPVSGEIGSE